jgi:hypothetical protein
MHREDSSIINGLFHRNLPVLAVKGDELNLAWQIVEPLLAGRGNQFDRGDILRLSGDLGNAIGHSTRVMSVSSAADL